MLMKNILNYLYQVLYKSNQMQRESKFSQTAIRPKIFDEWPKKGLKYQQSSSPQRYLLSKQNQSLRAEQTLQKSLMNLQNIKNFLSQKKRLQQTFRQCSQISDRHRKQLQSLSIESGVPFDSGVYEQALRRYYFHIRNQTKILRQAQCFKYSNLPNFDPKSTAIKYTRPKGSTSKQLDENIQQIQQKRNRLQQSLVIYEQNIPKSQILFNQFNLQQSLDNLARATTGDKLTNLHYLMQYQLKDVQDEYNKFKRRVDDDRANYANYQALNDSMKLMVNQRKQMKKDRQIFKTGFNQLNYNSASQIIPATNSALPILVSNEKIYDSNMQLLARYNAETNLNDYASRRKSYASQLDKYKNQFVDWRKQHQLASYLFMKHQILNNFRQKRSLTQNQAFLKAQRQDVVQGYYDCLNCSVPEKMVSIQNYRMGLLDQYQRTMKNQNIMFPEPGNLLTSGLKKDPARLASQQSRMQKYLDFFMALERKSPKQKALFLLAQKDSIRASRYQLQSMNDKSPLSQFYKTGFDFAQAIVQHQQYQNDGQYTLNMQNISGSRLKLLPIGLDPLLYPYTMDVMIKKEAQNYILGRFAAKMRQYGMLIQKQLTTYRSGQKQVTQIPYIVIKFTPAERRQFFFNFYRKISDFSFISKRKLLDDYWKVAERQIVSAYINSGYSQKSNSIQKKNFLTFRVLSYLVQQGGNLKIDNLTQIINYYLSYIDRYEFYRSDQTQLFLEIVKQRILIGLLNQRSNRSQEFQIDQQMMQKLNQACMILYEVNDHLDLWNQNDIQTHFQHSLKLQKAWNELRFQKRVGLKFQLQQKCQKVISNLRKDPILLGTKADLESISAIVNIKGSLQKIRKVVNLRQDFSFLSAVYIRTNDFLRNLQKMNYPYTSSDIISIQQHQNQSIYLSQLQQYGRKELSPLQPQLQQIMGIFKGNKNKNRVSVIRDSTDNQAVLQQIISKLENMANFR